MNKSKKRNTKKRNTHYVYKGGYYSNISTKGKDDIIIICDTLNKLLQKADQEKNTASISIITLESYIDEFIVQITILAWLILRFVYNDELYNMIIKDIDNVKTFILQQRLDKPNWIKKTPIEIAHHHLSMLNYYFKPIITTILKHPILKSHMNMLASEERNFKLRTYEAELEAMRKKQVLDQKNIAEEYFKKRHVVDTPVKQKSYFDTFTKMFGTK